jgi:hypothetical protein
LGSSREQTPLEVEDWGVVDVTCLAKEADSEYGLGLREGGQLGHHQPVRVVSDRPYSTGEA